MLKKIYYFKNRLVYPNKYSQTILFYISPVKNEGNSFVLPRKLHPVCSVSTKFIKYKIQRHEKYEVESKHVAVYKLYFLLWCFRKWILDG